jgi:group I intron endonuclease
MVMTCNSGIYAIEHIATGRKYIGGACDFGGRWREHKYRLRKGAHHSLHLQRAWDKYGAEAFEFKVLLRCERSELLVQEQAFLDRFKPELNILMTARSSVGRKANPEAIARMVATRKSKGPWISDAVRERWRRERAHQPPPVVSAEGKERTRIANTGRKHTPEAIEKIRLASTGRRASPENIEKSRARMLGNKYCLGRVVPDEVREKIAATLRGRTRPGRPHTLASRAKMSAAKMGHPVSQETRQKISETKRRKREAALAAGLSQ